MSSGHRLWMLAVAHIVIGVVATSLAQVQLPPGFGLREIPYLPLFPCALAQALLVAFWGAASTVPAHGVRSPATSSSSVDLPTPEGPVSAVSPGPAENEIPLSTNELAPG